MSDKKHILFLTWKDIRHPHAGGAELVMHEYAKGLVKKGYQVTWFASSAKGHLREEMMDEIHIIRKYSQHTIWLFAWWWYSGFKRQNHIDLIVDEAGGWPLLSPLYEKKIPIVFFAHHIGDKEFDAFPWIVGHLAKWVYQSLFRLYRHTPTIAVSESTKQELIDSFGYDKENITVISNTTDIEPIEQIDWEHKTNDLLFLGRLTTIKRTEDAIRAFAYTKNKIPSNSRLSIIGNSQDIVYTAKLHKLAEELGIADRVIFHGYIARSDFSKIIASHRCILVPSEKEGFGLIVLEANAYGLPAIAYDVAGLRDSVKPGVNGILVPDGDYRAMGEEIIRIFEDEARYQELSESSLKYVRSIQDWKDNVEKFEKVIILRINKL